MSSGSCLIDANRSIHMHFKRTGQLHHDYIVLSLFIIRLSFVLSIFHLKVNLNLNRKLLTYNGENIPILQKISDTKSVLDRRFDAFKFIRGKIFIPFILLYYMLKTFYFINYFFLPKTSEF